MDIFIDYQWAWLMLIGILIVLGIALVMANALELYRQDMDKDDAENQD